MRCWISVTPLCALSSSASASRIPPGRHQERIALEPVRDPKLPVDDQNDSDRARSVPVDVGSHPVYVNRALGLCGAETGNVLCQAEDLSTKHPVQIVKGEPGRSGRLGAQDGGELARRDGWRNERD